MPPVFHCVFLFLLQALEVIQIEKKKAKALDEELSAQRFCNYTLRTKIKNLLSEW